MLIFWQIDISTQGDTMTNNSAGEGGGGLWATDLHSVTLIIVIIIADISGI